MLNTETVQIQPSVSTTNPFAPQLPSKPFVKYVDLLPHPRMRQERISLSPEDKLFDQQVDSFYTFAQETGEKKHLLPHTGFNIQTQINQFETDITKGLIEGLEPMEIVNNWKQKVSPDIYGFVLEYLKGQAFLPFKNSLGFYEGQWRLMSDHYGRGTPIVHLLRPEERGGAVIESIQELENFLLYAPQGAIAVRTSPPGKSGLYVNKGEKEIVYKDTQTQIYQKGPEGIIHGYTIRTAEHDMGWRENKKLLEELGYVFLPDFDEQPNESRLNLLSKANVFLLPETGVGVKDVVKKIQTLTNNRAFGGASFESVLQDVDRSEEILQIDKLAGEYINRFLRFVSRHAQAEYENTIKSGKTSRELTDRIAVALGLTILELMNAYKHLEKNSPVQKIAYGMEMPFGSFEDFRIKTYEQMTWGLSQLQKLAGCAGGGTNEQGSLEITVPTVLGPRTASLDTIMGKDVDLNSVKEIRCPECKQTHRYKASEAQRKGQLQCKTEGCNNKTACWEPFFSKN